MTVYRAYGCAVKSDIPLPFVKSRPGTKKIDIRIRIQKIPDSVIRRTAQRDCFSLPQKTVAYEPGVGKMVVENGREILIDPDKNVDPVTLCAFVSPKIGVALHQKGFLVLHASAVEIAGQAVAFLGGPHWGKSTTVSMLQRNGHPLMTDDALAIRFVRGKALAYPGYPRLKLWPDTLKYMQKKPSKFPRLISNLTKRVIDLKENFDTSPRPLGIVYVLDKGRKHAIEPLSPKEAFIEATRHNYTILAYRRYGIGSKFAIASELVRTVPFFRLKRKMDKRQIPALISLIENHASQAVSQ